MQDAKNMERGARARLSQEAATTTTMHTQDGGQTGRQPTAEDGTGIVQERMREGDGSDREMTAMDGEGCSGQWRWSGGAAARVGQKSSERTAGRATADRSMRCDECCRRHEGASSEARARRGEDAASDVRKKGREGVESSGRGGD